jgi:hypothetical protein
VAIPLALLATGLARWSGQDAPGAPVAGESLEPAAAGLDPARIDVTHMALTPAPKLSPPLVEGLGDFAKALEAASGESSPAAPAGESAPAAPPRVEQARTAPPLAAQKRAAAPTAAPKARATRSERAASEADTRAKPRPWWLPEPERARKSERPRPNGVGANNAPIFD